MSTPKNDRSSTVVQLSRPAAGALAGARVLLAAAALALPQAAAARDLDCDGGRRAAITGAALGGIGTGAAIYGLKQTEPALIGVGAVGLLSGPIVIDVGGIVGRKCGRGERDRRFPTAGVLGLTSFGASAVVPPGVASSALYLGSYVGGVAQVSKNRQGLRAQTARELPEEAIDRELEEAVSAEGEAPPTAPSGRPAVSWSMQPSFGPGSARLVLSGRF